MSSPVVAGVATLYLEKCNQTNYAHFKSDLIYSAYGIIGQVHYQTMILETAK